MLEVAEKEKYEKIATGKDITFVYFEILVKKNISLYVFYLQVDVIQSVMAVLPLISVIYRI